MYVSVKGRYNCKGLQSKTVLRRLLYMYMSRLKSWLVEGSGFQNSSSSVHVHGEELQAFVCLHMFGHKKHKARLTLWKLEPVFTRSTF